RSRASGDTSMIASPAGGDLDRPEAVPYSSSPTIPVQVEASPRGAPMGVNDGKRVRVTLRWIQIKDKLEPFFKDHGEFRLRARVTVDQEVKETRFTKEGHWEISDHPGLSKVDKIDKVLFDAPAGDALVVELFGEEV